MSEQQAKVQGTYLVMPDGGQVRVKMKKVKVEDINPPPVVISGRFVGKGFERVYNGSLPQFRPDAVLRILRELGVDISSKDVQKHLGFLPFCAMCGEELSEAEGPSLEDGTTLCSSCHRIADDEGWSRLPEGKRFKLDLEIPEVLTQIFKGDALKQFHGMLGIVMMQLGQIPLEKTSRVMTDRHGSIVAKDGWRRYLVKEADPDTGNEILEEFPYLRKTHFLPVNEGGQGNNVHSRIYWDQFKTLDKGSYYEVTAYDDAGRFALWKLARRYMSGEYQFPDGTKGEAMIVVDGYHATSGTTQEYIALLAPLTYVDEGGVERFLWVMKTTQTRIKWSEGMEIPREGEMPTVAAKTVVLNKTFNEMLVGLVKAT